MNISNTGLYKPLKTQLFPVLTDLRHDLKRQGIKTIDDATRSWKTIYIKAKFIWVELPSYFLSVPHSEAQLIVLPHPVLPFPFTVLSAQAPDIKNIDYHLFALSTSLPPVLFADPRCIEILPIYSNVHPYCFSSPTIRFQNFFCIFNPPPFVGPP